MATIVDGPVSPLFRTLDIGASMAPSALQVPGMSDAMRAARDHALQGGCVCWGVPFSVGNLHAAVDTPLSIRWAPLRARCIAFMHTLDRIPLSPGEGGMSGNLKQMSGLGEPVADYVFLYANGQEERVAIKRRHQVGCVTNDICMGAVPHRRSIPTSPNYEQPGSGYGWKETRAPKHAVDPWMNWLWGWENPYPEKETVGLRVEPVAGAIIISAITAGDCEGTPFRWRPRKKAILSLPEGTTFVKELDEQGLLAQIRLDLGHVISAKPRTIYPDSGWEQSPPFQVPKVSSSEILVEYASHADARFHFDRGPVVPVSELEEKGRADRLTVVPPADRLLRFKFVDSATRKIIPVKIHLHGGGGEYLAPADRHRLPNPGFFEDYGAEHCHEGLHIGAYIPGETLIRAPAGPLFVEVSRGFEYQPMRTRVNAAEGSGEITIPLAKSLDWRERGWVTADTHVHFLSPQTALLEGACEGVNVVNLLASQWGEMMTNVGDFDGKTTFGSRDAGGNGEYLVRVGTENRQHVLGHISLLGYQGAIISPLCAGGPDESALGDAVDSLLTEWAHQCREQKGLVVMSHIPIFSIEAAAAMVEGLVDAVEMVSWGNMYSGLNPYSLAHWYRYLNCGYHIPAVGGTDKMAQNTAVGTVRTYARVPAGDEFTYESWMRAITGGETFVTYGPLMELRVEGRSMGSAFSLPAGGGTVELEWEAASVTVPMSRVDIIVNGMVAHSQEVDPRSDRGRMRLPVDKSCWIGLLVRGCYPGKPEIVAAHSSAVVIRVGEQRLYAPRDALSILRQIEGSLVFLDSLGTRAEEKAYKRMRLTLETAHRRLHNRMHAEGLPHIDGGNR